MPEQTDEQLIRGAQKGDMAAMGALIERYKLPLYNFIYYLIKEPARTDDVFQEVFIRVIKSIKGYQHKGRFRSWIYRIANNIVIDIYRKDKREKTVPLDGGDRDGEEWALQPVDTLSAGEDPEKELSRARLESRLQAAVECLPFEQRQIYLLRTQSDLSFKEIAVELKCPLNTALGRMRYALMSLRKVIEETD